MHVQRTAAAGRGGGRDGERGEDNFILLSRRLSSPPYSSTASTQHDVVMARFDTVGSKYPAAVGVLLPAELQGLSTFPVEELESFFVVPWSDLCLYFAVVQLFG